MKKLVGAFAMALLVGASLAVWACSSSNGTNEATALDSGAASTIGAKGGTVSSADGKVTLTIPEGALDHDVALSIVATASFYPGTVGQAVDIQPSGTTFQKPATLTFAYADLGGQDPSKLAIITDAPGAAPLPVSFSDKDAHTIGTLLAHLSPYALARFECDGKCNSCFDSCAKEAGGTSDGCSSFIAGPVNDTANGLALLSCLASCPASTACSDAGACTEDAGAQCNTLAIPKPVGGGECQLGQSKPVMTGGTIPAGTYDLVQVVEYGATACGLETQFAWTLQFCGNVMQQAYVRAGTPHRQSSTFTTSGSVVSYTDTCEDPGNKSKYEYTVSGDQFILLTGEPDPGSGVFYGSTHTFKHRP